MAFTIRRAGGGRNQGYPIKDQQFPLRDRNPLRGSSLQSGGSPPEGGGLQEGDAPSFTPPAFQPFVANPSAFTPNSKEQSGTPNRSFAINEVGGMTVGPTTGPQSGFYQDVNRDYLQRQQRAAVTNRNQWQHRGWLAERQTRADTEGGPSAADQDMAWFGHGQDSLHGGSDGGGAGGGLGGIGIGGAGGIGGIGGLGSTAGGLAAGGALGAAYDSAYNEARATNEARYEDILGGYEERYGRGMANAENLYDQEYADIRQQQKEADASDYQDLVSRGLSSSTMPTVSRQGNRTQAQRQVGSVRDRENQMRLSTDARLSGDRLGFMERRTDAYPDPNLLAQLSRGVGASGYGGNSTGMQFPGGIPGQGGGGGMPQGPGGQGGQNVGQRTGYRPQGGGGGQDQRFSSSTQAEIQAYQNFTPQQRAEWDRMSPQQQIATSIRMGWRQGGGQQGQQGQQQAQSRTVDEWPEGQNFMGGSGGNLPAGPPQAFTDYVNQQNQQYGGEDSQQAWEERQRERMAWEAEQRRTLGYGQ